MFRVNIIIFFVCAVFVACNTSKYNRNSQFSVTIDPTQNTKIKLSDYFYLDTIVQLSNVIVASIDNLIPNSNGYVVQGISDHGELLAFSSDGTFKGQIMQIGRGPNEAINIVDITSDFDGKLSILTNFGQQIDIYSPSDNCIERTIKLPDTYIARNIERLDSIRYVLYKDLSYSSEPEYKISIFNERTEKVEQNFLPLNKESVEYISFIQRNNLFRHDDGMIYFFESFNDTVYRATKDALEPFLAFDKGQFGMPEEMLTQGFTDVMQFADFCKESSYIWAHLDCYRCGDMFISRYKYLNQLFINISDISLGRSKSSTTIYDDILLHKTYEDAQLPIVGTDGEYLYLGINSSELIDCLQGTRFTINSLQEGMCLVRLKIKTN